MRRLPVMLRELPVRVGIIGILSTLLVPLILRDVPQAAAPAYLVKDLGTFGTIQSSHANDLNDAGRVAGQAASRAFLWDGALNQLHSVAGAGASGLNETGQVVGSAATGTTPGTGSHAVLWQNGAVTDLTPDLPAGHSASASAINEGGQVAGTVHYAEAFLWQNGSRISLGHLGGGASGANDINDGGRSWAVPIRRT